MAGSESVAGSCALLTVQQYTPPFNMTLADEIEKADRDAVWVLTIADYIQLRDEVKACKGK